MTARRVRCRSGRSTGPVAQHVRAAASIRRSRASGGSSRTRAAANSIAKRQPVQPPADLGDAAGVAARRRPDRRTGALDEEVRAHSVGQRRDGVLLLATQPQRLRLVTSTVTAGMRSRSAERSAAAATTCSKLSSTSSVRLSPRAAASASTGCAPASGARGADGVGDRREDEAGLGTAASGTKTTPPGNASATVRAASTASRVLPMPPGPMSGDQPAPRSRAAARDRGDLRLAADEVAGQVGRRVFRPASVRGGGKSMGRPGDVELDRRTAARGSP